MNAKPESISVLDELNENNTPFLARALSFLAGMLRMASNASGLQPAGSPRESVSEAKPVAASLRLETKFRISFVPNKPSDDVGLITLGQAASPGLVRYVTERPGDLINIALSSPGQMVPMVASGEGSEVRFTGTQPVGDGILVAAKWSRVCLKKSGGAWVYVCGVGEYIAGGRTNRLGLGRTVDSCMNLLAGPT